MHTSTKAFLISALLCMPLFFVGCSGIRQPRFESVGVREVERTDSRVVYAFVIKATNPNKESVPLKEISYRVTLDGQHTFDGLRSPETTLYTYAEHTFELPAVFEITRSELAGVIDYKIQGQAKYMNPGKLSEVLFDSKIKVPKVKFNLRGQVNTDSPE